MGDIARVQVAAVPQSFRVALSLQVALSQPRRAHQAHAVTRHLDLLVFGQVILDNVSDGQYWADL